MGSSFKSGLTAQDLNFTVYHVFLPPKLPGRDDITSRNEDFLTGLVFEALSGFRGNVDPSNHSTVDVALTTMKNMRSARDHEGGIHEDSLRKLLQQLPMEDGIIPLYIKAQNAGMIVRKVGDDIIFEVFELSPSNSAVMKTQGRLRRLFPAAAVAVSLEKCRADGLLAVFTETVVNMSHSAVKEVKPTARKTQQLHVEERDTVNPRIVTELLLSLLRAVGSPVKVSTVTKNTREDIVWNKSKLPWRRSAFWLLIRVALQLTFDRLGGTETSLRRGSLYKPFMAFFMSCVLDKALEADDFACEVLHTMRAKVSKRLLKLKREKCPRLGPWVGAVESVLINVQRRLELRRSQICRALEPSLDNDFANVSKQRGDDDVLLGLPDLDEFVRSINRRQELRQSGDFHPTSQLIPLHDDSLPRGTSDTFPDGGSAWMNSDTYLGYRLKALEFWVASNLDDWVEGHKGETDACARILRLMEAYHYAANSHYAANPEEVSIMVLTIFELWVACDKMAVVAHPLLGEYDPEVRGNVLRSLLFTLRGDMERLGRAEDYLLGRRDTAAAWKHPSILRSFGDRQSFATRFYALSTDMQQLLGRIVDTATVEREEKMSELQTLKAEYARFMNLYNEGTCDYYSTVDEYGITYQHHRKDCVRCDNKAHAAGRSIIVHEWPLPDSQPAAHSIVFELSVPEPFRAWRDATVFLIYDVLMFEAPENSPDQRHTLVTYIPLSCHRPPAAGAGTAMQRVYLLSESKPHYRTHRREKTIKDTTEQDVCVKNGLQFKYFDSKRDSFVGGFESTQRLSELCTFKCDDPVLQPFMTRPHDRPHGKPPNEVIASQASCPPGFSLDEYMALVTLPLGFRIQWKNILEQLAMPRVDFNRADTVLFLLQTSSQVGPSSGRGDGAVLRASHRIVATDDFGCAMLSRLQTSIDRIKDNWECCHTLWAFVLLAARALSLTPSQETQGGFLKLLARCRKVALRWIGQLQEKQAASAHALAGNNEERLEHVRRILRAALICADTFNVDQDHLEHLLLDVHEASILLECSMVIQETISGTTRSDTLQRAMLQRWRRLVYRALPTFVKQICESECAGNTPLDVSIARAWSAYIPSAAWRVETAAHYWVVSEMNGDSSSVVHFNLLTGELLVSGVPLSRLPSEYRLHPAYSRLFGMLDLDAMHSAVPGMRFSGKREHEGQSLHFGMQAVPKDSTQQDLLVHSISNSNRQNRSDLVPWRVLVGMLPVAIVEDYVYWYHHADEEIELRPITSPWRSAADNFRLVRRHEHCKWQLLGRDEDGDVSARSPFDKVSLINPSSRTGRFILRVFSSLETPLRLHIWFNSATSTLDVKLPRLRLGFYVKEGSSSIRSRQFQGTQVDTQQAIGTLVGCKSKLLLKSTDGRHDGIILVLRGALTFTGNSVPDAAKCLSHPLTTVEPDTATGAEVFHVDRRRGRLADNGTLSSKLYLAYLHAVTSLCLPDPLTGRTGTEQALDILQSAAVDSFSCLGQDDIDMLTKIACLTPNRAFYPLHEKVMQEVSWHPNLSFLSQHGWFYKLAKSIFGRAKDVAFLHADSYIKPKEAWNIDEHLLERDLIRSAALCTSEFGAEGHTETRDIKYQARDGSQDSDRATRACATAKAVVTGHQSLQTLIPAKLAVDLYRLLTVGVGGSTPGPLQSELRERELGYDPKWLDAQKTWLPNVWCRLHRSSVNRFRLMVWLATVSYAGDANPGVVQALIALSTMPSVRQIAPPFFDSFELHQGHDIKVDELRRAVQSEIWPFDHCPESSLLQEQDEEEAAYLQRRRQTHLDNQKQAVEEIILHLGNQWPCEAPSMPADHSACVYVNLKEAMIKPRERFETWHRNLLFKEYLECISSELEAYAVDALSIPALIAPSNEPLSIRPSGFVSIGDLFARPAPSSLATDALPTLEDYLVTSSDDGLASPRLAEVIVRLESRAETGFERRYLTALRDSLESLRDRAERHSLRTPVDTLRTLIQEHLNRCRSRVDMIYTAMTEAVGHCLTRHHSNGAPESSIHLWPRVNSDLFLTRLTSRRWATLGADWRVVIAAYGTAITQLNRVERISRLLHGSNDADLVKELRNVGHQNWSPSDYPESLLLEVESGLTIRNVQQEVAEQMRCPAENSNAVMQLNMGEGKSSVIVPIVAASLADRGQLVRVVVAKAQSAQMFEMLVSKLGGLLGRRVVRLPFSRAIRADTAQVQVLRDICELCMKRGDVLLVQPEHLASMQLMGPECLITRRKQVGNALLGLMHFFDTRSRDIVDESDENFSSKFELVYTMGQQRPIELSPDRWSVIQDMLGLVAKFAAKIKRLFPQSMELVDKGRGQFPRVRVFGQPARDSLLEHIVEHICRTGLRGFPIALQPQRVRDAVQQYLTQPDLTQAAIAAVEEGPFWTETTTTHLLLLRGLLACGILGFTLGQKRWRVNYGLDPSRQPPTQLAVPYRAKDNPTSRSEFSHPDVVIVLTCLSYYYGGLSNENLVDAFQRLILSDQADVEYQLWVATTPTLPGSFRHLAGVNVRDRIQCEDEVFPHLRFSKAAIDFFLSRIVFAKEMREFPHKLSASSWDLGKVKSHPTTGFSGTNDSRYVLPLDIKQVDLPEQKHTNALVLEHLLQPENSVAPIPRPSTANTNDGKTTSDGELLLTMVAQMKPETRVILDVGAQIIELSNVEVAKAWLKLTAADRETTQAVVFVDDNDDLTVMDRSGRMESLQTSPFARHLGVCLVFLDEAHTRGIDLKLPENYRAAVTLGANVTKDRLVQACMRMRKLGKGQSVVFCVPEEVEMGIRRSHLKQINETADGLQDMTVSDVLVWAISETCLDVRRSAPLWAAQGQRFEWQRILWEESPTAGEMTQEVAAKFLEVEAQSLDHRYRPTTDGPNFLAPSQVAKESSEISTQILQHCRHLDGLDVRTATLQEEQERELSPELEEERQVARPRAMKPAFHFLHPSVRDFVQMGRFWSKSDHGFMPAFVALANTTAAENFDVGQFPEGLWVTQDFANTVRIPSDSTPATYRSDCFQRSVQWVLTSTLGTNDGGQVEDMLILSPFEANELLPEIEGGSSKVALHMYAPRLNLGFTPLDHLRLFTMSSSQQAAPAIPRDLITQLNLFAGQLYFGSFDEYVTVCDFLGLASGPVEDGMVVDPDGFIRVPAPGHKLRTSFRTSPVRFLKTFVTGVRRGGEGVARTHLGRVLEGAVLTREEFVTE